MSSNSSSLSDSSTPKSSSISRMSIPVLLDWWEKRKRLVRSPIKLSPGLSRGDDNYLQAYYRLMEVYSVVKSGGVQAQTEAVKAFAEREALLLKQQLKEIEAAELAEEQKLQEREKVEQELDELRCANNWRLQTLTAIEPAEEAVVVEHLRDIEKTLMQVQCA